MNNLRGIKLKAGQQLVIPEIYSGKVTRLDAVLKETQKSDIVNDNILVLAKIIHAEARGEVEAGRIAVGAVVISRLISPVFPDTLRSLVFTPSQFAYYEGRPSKASIESALDAADGQDPSLGALYFYNPLKATNVTWVPGRRISVKIGSHIFLY
jgi:N-acetylmuramoyl-L-alanine amidase